MSDITRALRGKRIAAVMANGNQLLIKAEDGSEVIVSWVDGEGKPIKGKPVAVEGGYRLRAVGMQDLIHLPGRM